MKKLQSSINEIDSSEVKEIHNSSDLTDAMHDDAGSDGDIDIEEDHLHGSHAEEDAASDDDVDMLSDAGGDHADEMVIAAPSSANHLIFKYTAASPELAELFSVWDVAIANKNLKMHQLILNVLSSALVLVPSSIAVAAARKIIKNYIPHIGANLSSDSNKLVAASLRVLTSLVSIGDHVTSDFKAKFNFSHKGLLKVSDYNNSFKYVQCIY